jgi:hypothetical protein
MNDTIALVERLKRTAERIGEWRANVARFQATMGLTSTDETLDIERIIKAIQREIVAFEELVAEIERKSRGASADMAELRDTLRLLLMEFTELLAMTRNIKRPSSAAVEARPAA